MRFRATLLLVIAALLVVGGAAALWWRSGPTLDQFADLRAPRLITLRDQKMLVVDAAGDPNVVGSAAFKQLFSTYYSLEGVSRFGRPPAPRVRWMHPDTTPKDQWLGHYGLPLPDSVTELPNVAAGGLRTTITTWAYGDVAEILHVGPYSREQADIERLLRFIDARGYRVTGEHEEEYVKGPGMLLAGDPEEYLTIIRLPIEPATLTID